MVALGSRPSAAPPADPFAAIRGRLPGRDLSRSELSALAETIAGSRELWSHHIRHDAERRHYVELHRDRHVDAWLICWTNGQSTGFHDHDDSAGAVYVCDGDLIEDRFQLSDGVIRQTGVVHFAGSAFDFPATHVHQVRHPEGCAPAVSIHVYSPAIARMGYYDVGEDGLLRRASIDHTEELAA